MDHCGCKGTDANGLQPAELGDDGNFDGKEGSWDAWGTLSCAVGERVQIARVAAGGASV